MARMHQNAHFFDLRFFGHFNYSMFVHMFRLLVTWFYKLYMTIVNDWSNGRELEIFEKNGVVVMMSDLNEKLAVHSISPMGAICKVGNGRLEVTKSAESFFIFSKFFKWGYIWCNTRDLNRRHVELSDFRCTYIHFGCDLSPGERSHPTPVCNILLSPPQNFAPKNLS